ncbi:LysM peptidoglycan-binding domain-containing protein [Chryseotalea sanaruensis]|uniref:LysM peptidoglycan-binding domain-containing protein n=1 Tax=Chryseotalea sanaruensis TaxID=2482724 RepID=A0A401U9A6_9BACT|nr:LysM peptidoglycan-binding domain-containing protein [Chryseotalea sanaruensis]GCC51462.1 LysM peptidoglycan-binding domain-containing protein [Chryseotalea sanaruensis]
MMTLFALITSFSIFTHPVDSVGKETINGKVYVLHKVELKETLYGISKRYGTTVEAILQQNPTADGGLDVGQIIKVPYVSSPKKVSNSAGKHIVAEKETLYSVARLYGISVDDLRQMNKLTSDALSIGQELTVKRSNLSEQPVIKSNPQPAQSLKGVHTVASKETLFSISRQYGVSIDQLKQWNSLTGTELSLGQTLFVVAPENQGMKTTNTTITEQPPVKTTTTSPAQAVTPAEQPKETTLANAQPVISSPVKISEAYKDGKEVREAGLAELIEGTQGNRKYLALHRNAPIGTILKVKNQLNDREVFVRVIGQLPDTGGNDKLVIKVSKSAYDRLSAIDPKFMVEVTWYK